MGWNSEGYAVIVALSKEQYEWMVEAIEKWKQVLATLKEMQRLSRQELFETMPNPSWACRVGRFRRPEGTVAMEVGRTRDVAFVLRFPFFAAFAASREVSLCRSNSSRGDAENGPLEGRQACLRLVTNCGGCKAHDQPLSPRSPRLRVRRLLYGYGFDALRLIRLRALGCRRLTRAEMRGRRRSGAWNHRHRVTHR